MLMNKQIRKIKYINDHNFNLKLNKFKLVIQ